MTDQETAAPTEGSSEEIALSDAINQIQEEPETTETVETSPEGTEAEPKTELKAETEENSEPAEEKSPYSKAFTVLKKREKALTAKEKQLEEMEKRFTPLIAAEKSLREDPAEFFTRALEAIAPDNHAELLEEAFTKLSMKVLGVDAPKDMQEQSQIKKLQRELEAYKEEQARKEQEQLASAEEARHKAKEATALSEIRTLLTEDKHRLLMNNGEMDPAQMVYEAATRTILENNLEITSKEEAIQVITAVADYLEEEYKNVAQKWAKLVSPQPTPPQATNGTKTKPPATLTQAQTSKAPVRARSEDTEAERLKRALELIKEQP